MFKIKKKEENIPENNIKSEERIEMEREAKEYNISNASTATDEELEASLKQMRKMESEKKVAKNQMVMPGLELVATEEGVKAQEESDTSELENLAAKRKTELPAAGTSFKDKIGSFLLQSLDVFYRFPITTIFIITLSIINIVYIIIDDFNGNLEGAFTLGAITALLAELVIERGMVQRKIALPLPFAFTAIAFTLLQVFDNDYIPIGVGGVGVAVFAAIFYALYKEKEQPILSHLVKSAFICGIFTGIVFSGFTTCILAFNYLIFKFDDITKVIGIMAVLIDFLLYCILFLACIPKQDKEVTAPQIYRIIIHKALFYIYLLLIGILYLYIFKTIIVHKMPVGKYNWFGCFSLLFFVFFYLSVDEEDGKVQKLFKDYGAFLMIPVMIMQIIGLGIRISGYGLTTARFMSIVLILIATVFVITSILKKNVKYAFLGTIIISLLFTCTPFNIIDVPNRNQEKILKNTLSAAGVYNNGELDENVKINDEYLPAIRSAYMYLKDSPGSKSKFFYKFDKSKLTEGLDDYYELDYGNRQGYDYSADWMEQGIDVSGYKNIKRISGSTTKVEDKDLKAFFLKLKDEDGSKVLKYEIGDNIVYFDCIYYSYNLDDEDFDYIDWSGYLLSK